MAKQSEKQTEKPKQPDPQALPDQALVLFGGVMKMLPAELEAMGLAGKIQAREIPGVPMNWKPVNESDFLLGRCVDKRNMTFDAGTPKERKATVLVFDTAVPGGFRSVWLGADLRIKIGNDPVGKVYSIYYDGEKTINDISRKLNPMKSYRVFEIQPTHVDLPEGIEELESRKVPAVLWTE